jgi:hypothetical protein
MKLHNFFLFFLSFICTLSNALPASNNQCAAIHVDQAPLRNLSGLGISFFSDQVRIVIVDSYVSGTAEHAAGFTATVVNDYCTAIMVIFKTPGGPSFQQVIQPGHASRRSVIPYQVPHGGVLYVTITDRWF